MAKKRTIHLLHLLLLGACGLFLGLLLLPRFGSGSALAGKRANNLLINAGFEVDEGTANPTGWQSVGDVNADYTEFGGHSGNYRLTHYSAMTYTVETLQRVTGLSQGQYRLGVWVKSSGDQNEAYVALKNCGSPEARVTIPKTSPITWEQIELSVEVTTGECTVSLYSDAKAGSWLNVDDLELIEQTAPTAVPSSTASPAATAMASATATPSPTAMPSSTASPASLPTKAPPLPIRGADVSSLKKSEDLGGIYRDAYGTAGDALQILATHGMNHIRLRVWVDPADGYHTKQQILPVARRAKSLGMKLLLDFHYSDRWADPGTQSKPAAWASYDVEQLKKALYEHTLDLCRALVAQGTPASMIQIGNEINRGMLWPEGEIKNDNFKNLAELLKAGARAVNDCESETQIMLHLAEGGNHGLAVWWLDNIVSQEVPFDVIGFSYYPYWHGTLEQLQLNLNHVAARYDKDIVVVEFAYPFTLSNDDSLENIIGEVEQLTAGYPATASGQLTMTRQIMNIVSEVPNDHGLGIFYWDATWTAVLGNGWDPTDPDSGNAWENQALFDYNGYALPALREFRDYRIYLPMLIDE